MPINPDASETPRKALDDIRREIDAEYAPTDNAGAAPAAGGAVSASKPESVDETPGAAVDDFRLIADRHGRLMGRDDLVADHRPRRAGYLLAGLVGCVAGQVLLVAFLTVARYADRPQGSRTVAPLRAPGEAASAQTPQAPDVPETLPSPRADSAPTSPLEGKPAGSEDTAPAIVAAARAADAVAGASEALLPRAVPESRSAARQPTVLGATARAEAQNRLRSALNHWLRESARVTSPAQVTEPVIVVAPDGRTGKTYVSITSPIGLIPREQRWKFGPSGWILVEDRQSGLPISPPTPVSRDR